MTQIQGGAKPKARLGPFRRILYLTPRWEALLWAPAALIAAILGLFRLGRPLQYDEEVSLRLATVSWDRFAERVLGGDQLFGALYYGLLRVWSTVGADPFTIRLPSVVFAVATVPLLYLLARRLFGRHVAGAAAAMLAINPFFIRYAQEARAYALVLCLITLASYLLLRAMDRGSLGRWLAYGLAAAGAALAHLFAGFVLLVHVVALIRRRPSMHALVVLAVMAVGVVPFAIAAALFGPPRSFIPPITARSFGGAIDAVAGGIMPWPPVHALAYGLLAGLAVRRWRPTAAILFCAAWLAVPVALAAGISLAKPMFLSRYLIVILPAWVMLAAAGVISLRTMRPVTITAAAVLVLLSAKALAWWYFAQPWS